MALASGGMYVAVVGEDAQRKGGHEDLVVVMHNGAVGHFECIDKDAGERCRGVLGNVAQFELPSTFGIAANPQVLVGDADVGQIDMAVGV
jgi:hypothetical protein